MVTPPGKQHTLAEVPAGYDCFLVIHGLALGTKLGIVLKLALGLLAAAIASCVRKTISLTITTKTLIVFGSFGNFSVLFSV